MPELDRLMSQITSKYAVETVPTKIGERVLDVLQLKDYEEYILNIADTNEMSVVDMPFWAKVWEASSLLAYFLGKQPVVEGQRILEIGAGIGVVGVYAALCGHRVTITDINEDALLFAKANAIINGVADRVEVRTLDWRDPNLPKPFDIIVGSEVIYDRRSYPLLVEFLLRALADEGMVFLAKHSDLNTPAFFSELTKFFQYKHTEQTVYSDGEPQRIGLFAIRRKPGI